MKLMKRVLKVETKMNLYSYSFLIKTVKKGISLNQHRLFLKFILVFLDWT
jgi:hypothetical protein